MILLCYFLCILLSFIHQAYNQNTRQRYYGLKENGDFLIIPEYKNISLFSKNLNRRKDIPNFINRLRDKSKYNNYNTPLNSREFIDTDTYNNDNNINTLSNQEEPFTIYNYNYPTKAFNNRQPYGYTSDHLYYLSNHLSSVDQNLNNPYTQPYIYNPYNLPYGYPYNQNYRIPGQINYYYSHEQPQHQKSPRMITQPNNGVNFIYNSKLHDYQGSLSSPSSLLSPSSSSSSLSASSELFNRNDKLLNQRSLSPISSSSSSSSSSLAVNLENIPTLKRSFNFPPNGADIAEISELAKQNPSYSTLSIDKYINENTSDQLISDPVIAIPKENEISTKTEDNMILFPKSSDGLYLVDIDNYQTYWVPNLHIDTSGIRLRIRDDRENNDNKYKNLNFNKINKNKDSKDSIDYINYDYNYNNNGEKELKDEDDNHQADSNANIDNN